MYSTNPVTIKTQQLSKFSLSVLAILASLVPAGCQQAKMAVPNALAPIQEMAVVGRIGYGFENPFHFGPYQVDQIHYGWTETSEWGVILYSQLQANQQIAFAVHAAGEPLCRAQCSTNLNSSRLSFNEFLGGNLDWGLHSQAQFACIFTQEATGQLWKLLMTQSGGEMAMNGVLTNGSQRIDVRSTTALAGSSLPLTEASGYIFTADNQPVGSVDVINSGAVRIDSGSDSQLRMGLAGASAALLLYQSQD